MLGKDNEGLPALIVDGIGLVGLFINDVPPGICFAGLFMRVGGVGGGDGAASLRVSHPEESCVR